MPGTSSAEGGQQGPDTPKATSGVKNGFVRPVAVANIFRPVVTEDKPVLPERRRFSTFSDLKSTDTIKLSSTEASSRRQSCDIKSSAPFGQSLLRKTPKNPAPSVRTSANTSSTDTGYEDIKVKSEETKLKQAAEDVSVKPTDNSSALTVGVSNGSCPLPDDKGSRTVSAQNEVINLRKRGNRVKDSGSLKETKTEENDKYTADNSSVLIAGVSNVSCPLSDDKGSCTVSAQNEVINLRKRGNRVKDSGSLKEKKTEENDKCTGEINKDNVVSNQLPQTNFDRKGDTPVSSLRTSDKAVTLKTVASEQVKDSCGQKNDQSVLEKSKSNVEVSDKVTGQIIPKTLSNSVANEITNKPSESESQSSDHKDIQIPSNVRTVRRTSDVIAAKIQNIFCSQSEKQSTSSNVNRLRRGKNVLSRFEEKIQITPNEGKETSTAAVQNVSEVSKATEVVDTVIAISDVKTSVVFESSVNKEVGGKKPSQPGAAEKKSVSAESQQFTRVSNIVVTETSTQAKPVGKKEWTLKTTEQSKTEGTDVSFKKTIYDNKVLIETDITKNSDKNQTASKGFAKGLPPTLKKESKSKPNATDVKNKAQSENNSSVITPTGIIQLGSENKKHLLTDKQVTTSGVTVSSDGVSKEQPLEGKQKQVVEKIQHGADSAPSDKHNLVRQVEGSNKNTTSTSQDTKRATQHGPGRSSNIADKAKTAEVKQHSNSSISEATAATKTASKNQKAGQETSAEKINSATPEQISLSGGKTSNNQAESSEQQINLDKKQNDHVELTAQPLLTNAASTSHDSVRKTISSDKYSQLTSKQTTSITSSVSGKESIKHLKTETKCKGTSALSEKKTPSVTLNSSKKQINVQNQEENKKESDLIKDEKPVLNESQSVQKDAVVTETLKVDKVLAEQKGSAKTVEGKKIGIEKNTADTLVTKETVLLLGKEKSGIIVKNKENLTQQKSSDSKSKVVSTSSKHLVTVSSDSNASSVDSVKHTERKIDSSATTDKPKYTSEPVSYRENKTSTLFLKGNSKEDQSKGHPVSQIQKTSSTNADVLVQDTSQDKQVKNNASADSLSTKSQSPLKGKIEKEVTKSVDEIKTKVHQTASNEKEPIDSSSSKLNVLTSDKTNNAKTLNSSASTLSNILDSTDNVENKVDSHCQLEVSDNSQAKPSAKNFPTVNIQSSSADFIGTESKQQTSDDLNLSQEQPAARKNSFEHKIYDLQKQELVSVNLNTTAEEATMSLPRGISSKNSDMQVIDIKDLQRTLKYESPGSKLATDILLSSNESTKDIPRPPDRKRSSVPFRDSSLPPPLPLRTISRVGSLKRSDDSRFSIDRSLDILRSSSQSSMSPVHSYLPQKYSYTEMMAKLCSYGVNPSLSGSNRRFGASQVSELWADLSEEQSSGTHTSEMLEAETTERMRLEKEVQDLQSRFSHVQQKSEKMEMEMLEARVYRTTEVNGDLSEDEESEATSSIYKQKYERAVRDMEVMKRRLQQQHEEELEQKLMIKKATDKRLAEALEDIEEEKQVVIQWKRKAQKLGSELQDLRLMLEEQMARNGELEKKQRRFDAELSAAQEEIRKERLIREKLQRERDQAQHEKYSLEQELHSTRLDMDMQHEKITQLNRELDELALSSKGEEEVTQLKRAKQELERRARDQEEELEELAGQVQLLEQSKLRLEMSLEKQRQEHRRETSVREEEIEEIRASSSKKIKNLEAQLEAEQEDRHQLVKQKHELERRIIELNDQPPPHDPEIEHRLRRDLKRTKALLRDAQTMLEHMRDGQANKTLIRQLKNQLEDAEFAKTAALKARQGAELELQDLQSQLEELARTKNDAESRCLQLSREKSAYQAQLEEMEEEMAEVMKKYKATVAQMSIDQKSMAEQNQQISELETEKHILKEQLTEMSNKIDHLAGQTEDTHRVHRLDAKVRDLESKLELEQTTCSRLEHQIMRLKEQCDKMREECDSLRNKELQAQEGVRRLQRQLRELREDYTALQQKESEAYHKQHELEMALENNEADLQVTKNDLRLACQRIQDLQNALEEDLDSGTDVPDDSGSESDSSLDMSSVLRRQCLTPIQRHDSISSDLSLEFDGRRSRTSSFSQDMSILGRMMWRRTSMDFHV